MVQEVTTGLKSISELAKQLQGGLDFLLNKNYTGRIKFIVRTTNRKLAKQIERLGGRIRIGGEERDIRVILEGR